jgi:hypothetical protein
MDDLDRLFNHLVNHLAKSAPERLQKPFQVSELYQRLLPYRDHRRELAFDSIEDYEMAVLRLLAGEHEYVVLEPHDAQEALAVEAQMANPNPGAFREFAAATAILNQEAVRRIAQHDEAYAPPAPAAPKLTLERSSSEPPPASPDQTTAQMPKVPTREMVFEPVTATTSCPHCAEDLPAERTAVFCPFCGGQIGASDCRVCGESISPGWRYCLTCGTPIRRRPTDTE